MEKVSPGVAPRKYPMQYHNLGNDPGMRRSLTGLLRAVLKITGPSRMHNLSRRLEGCGCAKCFIYQNHAMTFALERLNTTPAFLGMVSLTMFP